MCRAPVRVVLLQLFCGTFLFAAQGQRDPNALQLGTAQTRVMGPGQFHRFSVQLEKDQLAHIVVYQRGIDVIVRVSSPDRRNVAEFDSPNGSDGAENVKIVAVNPGTYFVDISPLSPLEVAGGQFEIRLTEVRGATEPELQIARRPEINRAQGIALLATLADLLPEVRSAQTRVRYQIQVAQLLWPIDEKAARKLAADAMAEVRNSMVGDPSPDADQNERYYAPTQMRQEVFQLLIQQDPELALSFLISTRPPDPDSGRRGGQSNQQDLQLEVQVASRIATADSKRAFQIAQESLARGYSGQLGGVISTLRSSEPALATRLMKDAVTKLQEEKLLTTSEAANLAINLLQAARPSTVRNPSPSGGLAVADIPLLSPVDYRNLFTKTLDEALAVEIIPNSYSPEMNSARNILNSLKGMSEEMRNFAPGKSVLIEEKLARMNVPGNAREGPYREAITNSSVDVALEAIARAPQDLQDSLYLQLATKVANTDVRRARQIATSSILGGPQRQMALDTVERQVVQNAISTGRLEEAMAGIRSVKSRKERANMITQITNRIGQGHKADAVLNVLEEARSIIGVSPRVEDQETMNALLQIAGTLSRYDAARGFHIVEPLVVQFNDLTAAALAVNGFGQQYYQGGELALTNGNSLANVANQLTQVLARLAIADFDRARNAVERIQRPEVRAAAYLALAQQTINPSPAGGVRSRW